MAKKAHLNATLLIYGHFATEKYDFAIKNNFKENSFNRGTKDEMGQKTILIINSFIASKVKICWNLIY